jgi:thiol-disulfide isomerase/thioredoxin
MKIFVLTFSILIILCTPSLASNEYKLEGTYMDLNGVYTDFTKFEGKFLLIDAMATWCVPCKEQLNEIVNILPRIEEKITVFSLSVDNINDNIELVYSEAERVNHVWDFGWDYEGKFQQTFEVIAYPTLILFDPSGEYVHTWVGLKKSQQLLKELDEQTEGALDLKFWEDELFQRYFAITTFSTIVLISYAIYLYLKKQREKETLYNSVN